MWEIKTEPSRFGMLPKPLRFVKILLKKLINTLIKKIDVLKAHESDITHMQWFEKDRLMITSAKEKCIKV